MSQAIFTFDSALTDLLNGSWDLGTETFYCHLVTAQPSNGDSTVSDLSLPGYSNYTSVAAANVSYVSDVWKMDDFLFPANNSAVTETIHGAVVCRQLGANPAGTDQVVAYQKCRQSGLYVEIPLASNEQINIQIDQVGGLLSTQSRDIYNAGSHVTDNDTNGIFYLMGTNNNSVAWSNANQQEFQFRRWNTSSPTDAGVVSTLNTTDRIAGTDPNIVFIPERPVLLEMLNDTLIKLPTGWGFNALHSTSRANTESVASYTLEISGTQFLPTTNLEDADNDFFYTPLASFQLTNDLLSTIWRDYLTLPGSNQYFRYIRFKFNATASTQINMPIDEIEFYNCSIARTSPY